MPLLKPIAAACALSVSATTLAQIDDFSPVTQAMLENPSPNDWLMFSRTYDAQRYSPLDQIDTGNVGGLTLAWTRVLNQGTTETVPIVHDGVMYLVTPGAVVVAFDAASGDTLWTYEHDVPDQVANGGRTKNLAIYQDIIVYTAPDSRVVGLDARSGELRRSADLIGSRRATRTEAPPVKS
jgi:alcohol dehydrogenase (cytochrome c)